MRSTPIRAFFSCSFRPEDRLVVEYFRAICEGLDMACANVSTAFTSTPPEAARRMIEESELVVAVATNRSRIHGSDEFNMPEAVSNELSIAFGLKRPILVFKERSVRVEGFLPNYATFLDFSREDLQSSAFLERAVRSAHEAKLVNLSDHELLVGQEVRDYIAEEVSHVSQPERKDGGWVWTHRSERTLVYTRNSAQPIRLSRWNDHYDSPADSAAPPLQFDVSIIVASREFQMRLEIEKQTPCGILAKMHLDPMPIAGDRLRYFVQYQGRHMLPMFRGDLEGIRPNHPPVVARGRTFDVFDGVIPVNRTKKLTLQYRFPREYGVSAADVDFVVGSYTQEIDYMVDSELERSLHVKEEIGGVTTITLVVKSPLLRHIYGVAWNLPAERRG